MAKHPRVPIYLLYGNQTEAILRARDEILDMLVPAEFRDENLTEYYPTAAGDKIKLAGLMGQISGDLATLSFFPGAPKCVIVTNPTEIFGAAAGGGEAGDGDNDDEDEDEAGGGGARRAKGEGDPMLTWIERTLPETGSHLMLIAFEDEAARREINEKKPNALFKLIQRIGWTAGHRDQKAMFRIEDALRGRDVNELISAIRDVWKPGKSDGAVYSTLVRCVRFMLEANIARDRNLAPARAAESPLFPASPALNLFKAHSFVQQKYQPAFYRTTDLIKAYNGLLEVYRALRPRPGEVFVPDAPGMLEQVLVELVTSPRPRR